MPRILKLDVSVPSKALLNEAYALAKDVFDWTPWEQLNERQVLAIRFADGREGFVSVMGEEGHHLAVALYPSFATYMRIRSTDPNDAQCTLDTCFSVSHLQLAFNRANQLYDGEMRDIKASGVKFKRGFNPSFASYLAGFKDDRMGAAELTRYLSFLRAFRLFCDLHGPDAIADNDRPGKMLTTWTEDASGEWSKGEDEYSTMLPVGVSLDENLIKRVADLPISEKPMTLEVAAFPVQVGRAPNGRVKMSRLVVAVEGLTHFAMGATVVDTPDGRELDWTPVVEFALKTMVKFGKRPTHIAAFGLGLYGVLKPLTVTRFKGTEFMPRNPCKAAREVFDLLQSRFM